MGLHERLTKLEGSGRDGMRCRHQPRVIWPLEDGREPSGPAVCPLCGLARLVIRVVYDGPPSKA